MFDRAETLKRAVEEYRGGRLQQAAHLYGEVLDHDPTDTDALQLLGLVAHRLGHHDTALELFERALNLDPEHFGALVNRAAVLRTERRYADAERDLRRASSLRPDAVEPMLELARVALHLDRAPEAEALARAAIVRRATVEPLRLLAMALSVQRRFAEAISAWDAVLSHLPDDADGHGRRGEALAAVGRDDEALVALSRSLTIDPSDALARYNRGLVRCRTGRDADGLADLAAAAEALPWVWISFADAAASADVVVEPRHLLECYARPEVDHQGLDRPTRRVLEQIDGLAQAVEPSASGDGERMLPPGCAHELRAHALLVPWLSKTVVRHPGFEEVLRGIRTGLLREVSRGEHAGLLPVLQAFARQGFHNEYAWWGSEEDRVIRAMLEAAVVDRLPREPYSDELAAQLSALAMYAPLHGIEGVDELPRRTDWAEGALGDLLREQLGAIAMERELALALPVVGLTDDPVSVAVRAMYEQNPYPRLASVHRKPPERLDRILRSMLDIEIEVPAAPEILIAGCGTGQQVLSAATRYEGARVFAVDLSRVSLGVAARQVREWGLDNVELAQADILSLDSLGRQFDLVEAGGVLHHLAEPMRGWRILVDLVRPGGLMKIALYSERGRGAVIAGRELVAERGFLPTRVGLRRARRAFLNLQAHHPARPIVWSPDFYSLSGFRDLVFHVQEHRFTLPALAEALETLGLELLGFQHPRPEVAAWYRERFPDDRAMIDLVRWDAIEREHPDAFAGMYQFWARRVGGRQSS